MREQIALTLYRIAGYTEDFETTFPHKSWANLGEKAKASWYRKADQIHKEYMAWFLSKLKPLSDEEIDRAYVNGWSKRNVGVDSPLQLKQTGEDADELDVLGEIAQAQLDAVKKELEGK